MKTIICTALLVSGISGPAFGQIQKPEWHQFHGPGRRNVSPDTGLMKKWPEGGPKMLWHYSKCGIGFGGPAIAGKQDLHGWRFWRG